MTRSPPEDAWHITYCIFFLQGIGQLFPWNVFINAEDYFRRRLCGSSFENNFENFFSVGYNLAAIVGLLLALRQSWIGKRRGRQKAITQTTFLRGPCGASCSITRSSLSGQRSGGTSANAGLASKRPLTCFLGLKWRASPVKLSWR
ncbi:unnamed protein product [Pylaiella littoralis]